MQIAPGRTHRYFTGKPLYPFGFGLGYTSFSYSNLTVSHTMVAAGAADVDTVLTVSVSVTNNGEYEGSSDEVVMVFAKPTLTDAPTSTMSVPKQILGGFTKVATLPGTTTVVSVEVPMRHLRLVGPDDTSFGLLQGRYELHVGGRSPGDGIGVEGRSVQQLLTADLHVE
jgi:beta-glucosidase